MPFINQCVECRDFPCKDVHTSSFFIPNVNPDTEKIHNIIITEAPPVDLNEHFFAPGNPFYLQTTLQAFKDAGYSLNSIQEILNNGIYLTTALKCAKTGYGVSAATINNCTNILEKELALFPNIKSVLLGGDVAIKMLNLISKRKTGKRVIPAESTYKIRNQSFYYQNIRVYPSYVMTGKNYLIEKSKRQMIAEDLEKILNTQPS